MKAHIIWFTLLILTFNFSNAEKLGCGDDYDMENWDCDSVFYHLSPSNLEKTLYCIGYHKVLSPKEAMGLDYPSKIWIEKKIESFDSVDEQNELLYFKEWLSFEYWHDQINFYYRTNVTNCIPPLIEYHPDLLFKFVPEAFFGNNLNFDHLNFHLFLVC